MREYILGIDVGGTKIAFGLFNSQRVIVYYRKIATKKDATPDEMTQILSHEIDDILHCNNLTPDDLKGIAAGFPSYVDFARGVIVFTTNMVNLKNYHAKKALSERYPGVEIIIDNDTNIAALAEHRLGAGCGFDHMLFTAVSTGVGSGFIINNQLYRGAYGGAGESGHMLITPDQGIECGCENRGCFMSYTSGSMIMRHARLALEAGEKSLLSDLVDGDLDLLSAAHLNTAYCKNDPLATRLLDQIGYYLGVYVYNMFIGMNFNCYVFGGGMVQFGDALFDRIRATFDRYNHAKDQEIYLKPAEVGEDCAVLGAALLFEPRGC